MKICAFLTAISLFIFGCQKKEIPVVRTPDDLKIAWHDVTDYSYLSDDSKEGKLAVKTAKKSRSYKNYDTQFILGNLAVIKGSTPPSPLVMDGDSDNGYLGVLLGDNAQVVRLPNNVLFTQFMTAIRPAPETMKLEWRLRVFSVLGGFETPQYKKDLQRHYLLKQLGIEPRDPTWHDEDGKLSISYYAYRSRGSMMVEELVLCQIDVDAEQKAEESCRSMEEIEESPEAPAAEDK